MYEIDLNLPKQIVADVLSNHEIHSVAFVGCGASMSDLYPAKYFLANNTDKLNVQIFTANEFNYDTPSWVNEHTFVITCSLGGSTPETVEANKTAKKHNCPVVSLTNKAGSALTVDADYVIVHGFHANFAAKCEKPGYAIALALEILQQTEGYDHYEDMITGLTNIFELIENAAHSAKGLAKQFAQANGNGSQGELGLDLALGPAQMSRDDHLCARVNQPIEGGQSRANAAIVSDIAICVERDVEIRTDENFLAREIAQ